MRRFAPLLLVFALAACGSPPPESAIGEGYADEWPRIGPQTLAQWSSFPATADPRPLVLLGNPVSAEHGFADAAGKSAFEEGRLDPVGKVPPEAAEAFAQLTKSSAGEPKIKVTSARKATATFTTDRGPRELPAWIFQLAGANGPVAVLAIKPDHGFPATSFGATVSGDGMTLLVRMPGAPIACGGEAQITYHPEWLESPTAVAVGLKKQLGKTVVGNIGTCRHMPTSIAEYTVTLKEPLGNRVLVAANSKPLPVLPL